MLSRELVSIRHSECTESGQKKKNLLSNALYSKRHLLQRYVIFFLHTTRYEKQNSDENPMCAPWMLCEITLSCNVERRTTKTKWILNSLRYLYHWIEVIQEWFPSNFLPRTHCTYTWYVGRLDTNCLLLFWMAHSFIPRIQEDFLLHSILILSFTTLTARNWQFDFI